LSNIAATISLKRERVHLVAMQLYLAELVGRQVRSDHGDRVSGYRDRRVDRHRRLLVCGCAYTTHQKQQ
jgi:hypothetical protein